MRGVLVVGLGLLVAAAAAAVTAAAMVSTPRAFALAAAFLALGGIGSLLTCTVDQPPAKAVEAAPEPVTGRLVRPPRFLDD